MRNNALGCNQQSFILEYHRLWREMFNGEKADFRQF